MFNIKKMFCGENKDYELDKSTVNYFDQAELQCRCKSKNCDKSVLIRSGLWNILNKIRAEVGFPMPVASGVRCELHNRKIGGVPESFHVKCQAVDITCSIMHPIKRKKIINAAYKYGITGIGRYKWGVHLDVGNRNNGKKITEWKG